MNRERERGRQREIERKRYREKDRKRKREKARDRASERDGDKARDRVTCSPSLESHAYTSRRALYVATSPGPDRFLLGLGRGHPGPCAGSLQYVPSISYTIRYSKAILTYQGA